MSSAISAALTETKNEYSAAVAANASKGSKLDKDDFLLLMVTQLKYQDPLDPSDNTEFASQLAQYSSLEELININGSVSTLNSTVGQQSMVNASSYIGKSVAASGSSISKETSSDGSTTVSTFRYALGSNISGGTLYVYDSSNTLIYQEDMGAKTAGTTYSFMWDGTNLKGENAPDGVYTVYLSCTDADGNTVLSDQVVDGVVTGVLTENDTIYVGLSDGRMIPLSDVRQVSETNVFSAADKESSIKSSSNSSSLTSEKQEASAA